MSPNLRERFEDWREKRTLQDDDPGAPPGYLLDPDDQRTGSHIPYDQTGCAETVAPELWDTEGDLLARGYGEDDGV